MAGGLEIVSLVASAFLEKVAKERRVSRDLPRNPRDPAPRRTRGETSGDSVPDGVASVSPTHIDVRA
jgi:hypothetical protein